MSRGPLLALALASLAACAASPARTGSVRRLDELPPAHAELWRAWTEDSADWPSYRRRALADPALAGFLVDNLVLQMVRAYDRADLTNLDRAKVGPFERARAELLVLHEYSTPVLVELVGVADSVVAGLAAGLAREIGLEAVAPTVELLASRDERTRLRAAELLADLPYAFGDEEHVRAALVERLERDPSWLVRGEAARALGRRGRGAPDAAPARAALVRGLFDDDPAVRRRSAGALADLADPAAIPALVDYLERSLTDGSGPDMRAAEDALFALSGERRSKGVREWRAWWRRR